jgi:hypothetical protein
MQLDLLGLFCCCYGGCFHFGCLRSLCFVIALIDVFIFAVYAPSIYCLPTLLDIFAVFALCIQYCSRYQ